MIARQASLMPAAGARGRRPPAAPRPSTSARPGCPPQFGAAELVDHLPAPAARHQQVTLAGPAGQRDQPAAAGQPQLTDQGAFGAQTQPVGGVLDIAAGDDPAVVDQRGGAHLQARVGAIGGRGGLDRPAPAGPASPAPSSATALAVDQPVGLGHPQVLRRQRHHQQGDRIRRRLDQLLRAARRSPRTTTGTAPRSRRPPRRPIRARPVLQDRNRDQRQRHQDQEGVHGRRRTSRTAARRRCSRTARRPSPSRTAASCRRSSRPAR